MAEKRCSICRRPPNEVKMLIGGQDGPWICDRCTEDASATLQDFKKKASGTKGAKTEEKPLLKPRQINSHLDRWVISQARAKKDIAVAVYNHYKRRQVVQQKIDLGVEIQKSNILILGPSGSGKTQIARSISKMLGVPFFNADATKLTQAGYVGDDVESLLQGLLTNADGDIERAQWGIIFLDEVDKIARKSGRGNSGYRDVTGEGVQQALLKMLEGSLVKVPKGSARMVAGQTEVDLIDTSNILFIVAGSFAGIEEIVERRVNKGVKVGFGVQSKKQDLTPTDVYSQFNEEDLLEFGLIPEFLGRVPVHTSTLPLTEDEMLQVLTEPDDALVKQFKALFLLDGIDLQFEEAALRAVAKEAQKRTTGARALRGILEKKLQPYMYDYPSEEDIAVVRITEGVILGTGEVVVARGKKKALPEPPPPPMAVTQG